MQDMQTRVLESNYKTLDIVTNLLQQNQIVAMPTDTVYGLCGNAMDDQAAKEIFALKQRPADNPLIVHVASIQQAKQWVHFDDLSLSLANTFWPGPLSLVLPIKGQPFSKYVTAGSSSVVVRMPNQPFFLNVLHKLPFPIAAPSANISGFISPTRAWHVLKNFDKKIPVIVDGGDCILGLESTIVKTNPFQVLRLGSVSVDALIPYVSDIQSSDPILAQIDHPYDVLPPNGVPPNGVPPNGVPPNGVPPNGVPPNGVPGSKYRHYAPKKRLYYLIEQHDKQATETLKPITIGFGPQDQHLPLNLSKSGDLEEAGKNLYDMLYQADQMEGDTILVRAIPNKGMGITINERLRKASYQP